MLSLLNNEFLGVVILVLCLYHIFRITVSVELEGKIHNDIFDRCLGTIWPTEVCTRLALGVLGSSLDFTCLLLIGPGMVCSSFTCLLALGSGMFAFEIFNALCLTDSLTFPVFSDLRKCLFLRSVISSIYFFISPDTVIEVKHQNAAYDSI